MLRFIPALLATALILAACATYEKPEPRPFDADLELLARWMSGSFSSEAQSLEDKDFFDIRLEVVPIWNDRIDGPWLYVEQAAATALDRPYRQRVYHLKKDGDTVISEVYTLPGKALDYAGAFKDLTKLASVTPDQLALRDGCSIHLNELGPSTWAGATQGKGCGSTLGGASYATSQVSVTPLEVRSWDQGFNASGSQVWGAEKGPYIFLKK